VSIDFDFGEAKSIASIYPYTTGTTGYTSQTLRADVNPGINYATLNSLVFKLPQDYIKEGSLTGQQYQYIKSIPVTFTLGQTIGGVSALDPSKEAFNEAGSDQENFMVFVASGNPRTVSSVTVDSFQVATITLTDTSYSGQATLYAVVNLNNGNNTNPKKKALTTGNTTYLTTSTSPDITATSSVTGATTNVYSTVGQATITNFNSKPGVKHSLYTSDVKRITAIYDLAGASLPAGGSSLSSYTNVIDRFSFDNGQRDSHYDHASISIKPRVGSLKGPLIVCFDWYDHIQGATDDALGFFTVDSYPNVTTTAGYTDIPTFTDSNGKIYSLRDCIDFRPRRKNFDATDPNYTFQGARIPNMDTNFELSYSYYLPRKSLLTMIAGNGGNYPFIVLDGKSSPNPVYPSNIPGGMVLYKLSLEPYTGSKDNVQIQFVENKRYTMRDIGVLEKRIENLEYYQSLSLLEKSATDMVIKDANGLDRTKNGIIVDDFRTHGIGDVSNPDYYIAMDKVVGAARAPQQATPMQLVPTSVSSVAAGGKYITLGYYEKTFISQPNATKYIPVNPYMYAAYIGKIVMDPSSDYWVDTTKAPDLIINFDGSNDVVAPPTKTLRNSQANSNTIVTKANSHVHGIGYGLWLNGLGVGYGTTNGSISWSQVFNDYVTSYTGNNTPLTQLSGFWNNHLGTPNR
jgi:hypothetical protein